MTSAPVLAFPQESGGEFVVDCDSSNVALGAVLSKAQDGQERVIAYYSKCFSRSERKYYTTRKNYWPWFAQSNIFIITCTGGTSLSEETMVPYVGS